MRRSLLFSFLSLVFFFSFISPARAAGDVFIISQVRGSEDCCQPGSLAHLQYQLDQVNQHHFAGSFLFRYDALTNPDLVAAFLAAQKSNPNLSVGLWLEITPSLAIDSSVVYRGNQKNWSKAEHSLLVGYSQKDRQKLLATLINQFHLSFPDEPLVVAGAWGIDTPSLNYLESIGVKIFQSVREQWGTDGFSVDGSAINRPYFPSSAWYLTPSSTPRDLIVIKHTISDPFRAYGDPDSTFTSQPNDFNKADLTVANYFAPLLSQALNLDVALSSDQIDQLLSTSISPSPRGWATIGLETSMEDQYQLQFGEQLDFLADLVAQGQTSVLTTAATVQRFITNQEAAAITLSPARDLLDPAQPLRAFWVETPSYRLRFRLTDQGVILDDARRYDPAAPDYYATNRAENGFYGVIPPLFAAHFAPKHIYRSSTHFLNYYTITSDDNPAVGQVFPAAAQDTLRFHHLSTTQKNTDTPIISAPIVSAANPVSSSASVSYLGTDNQEVTLTFDPQDWQSNVSPTSLPPSPIPAVILSPEIKSATPDPATSFFDWRNPYVRVNSLPSRLILYPLNQDSFPVLPKNISFVADPPQLSFTIHEQTGEYLFVDFNSPTAQKYQVQVYFGDALASEQTIYFVHDCQTDPLRCGVNPLHWWRFFQLKIQEKFLL